jgi:hypothetical protein
MLHNGANKEKERQEAEIERLTDELNRARISNTKLHRRVQTVESGVFKEELVKDTWRLRNDLAHRTEAWSHSFDRFLATTSSMKTIYEAAAPVLNLPYGKYHSVADFCFTDTKYPYKSSLAEPGSIYANVFLPGMGGIASYNINDVVVEAISTLTARAEIAEHLVQNLTLAKP